MVFKIEFKDISKTFICIGLTFTTKLPQWLGFPCLMLCSIYFFFLHKDWIALHPEIGIHFYTTAFKWSIIKPQQRHVWTAPSVGGHTPQSPALSYPFFERSVKPPFPPDVPTPGRSTPRGVSCWSPVNTDQPRPQSSSSQALHNTKWRMSCYRFQNKALGKLLRRFFHCTIPRFI